jgi:uncharacterized protein (TIGR02118 family)
MIKISILYPNAQTARFDFDYYLNQHIPLASKLLGEHSGYKGVSVERGLSGAMPNTEATYLAMCHFLFDSSEDFMAAFMPHAALLQGDIINYTDIMPVIQISEVLVSESSYV